MLEIIAASSLVAALIVAFSLRRPALLRGSEPATGQFVDDDLPCPWCLAPTGEDDDRCPSCGKHFG